MRHEKNPSTPSRHWRLLAIPQSWPRDLTASQSRDLRARYDGAGAIGPEQGAA